jgi:hypothetical protein
MADEIKIEAPKKSRSYGVNDILNWKFQENSLPEKWYAHLGDIPQRVLIYVDGEAGNGKTEYLIQLTEMFSNHYGKVHLNNIEQGKHRQVQESIVRNDFKNKIKPGKFTYSIITDYSEYCARIEKPQSGRVQVIDSISQWKLTEKQVFKVINHKKHRNKSFVLCAYKKHRVKNAEIEHLCDIKIEVVNFKAIVRSNRFGGGATYDIWPDRPVENTPGKRPNQVSLFQDPA